MVEHALDWVGGQWGSGEAEAVALQAIPARLGGGPESGGLLQQAIDALDLGLLVLAPTGRIVYYNRAYARLRGLAPGILNGQPVEALDRRRRVRELLRTGTLPPERGMPDERRIHQETIVPLWEGGRLRGVVVMVSPVPTRIESKGEEVRRRALGPANHESPWPARYTFADIIGHSPALVQARELARQAAQGGSSVLVVGESGTGKELFAHAIHAASPRLRRPFVPVDCSAIPRELLESELFGYAPGAFTGASRDGKAGKFELANGGTIFLDEIGEMPLEMQAKLLRVLQERQLIRVGGITPQPVTCSVIAATNRDLETLVAQGQFRRDLLYRLDVIRLEVPPLRERPEDIPLLVAHYWEQKSRELGRVAQLSAEALRMLESYTWPGNIRELVNVVERMLVGSGKPVIEPTDLPATVQAATVQAGGVGPLRHFPLFHLGKIVEEAERQTLKRALRQVQGNRNKAAQLVGLSRASFYRKLKAYGLLEGERQMLALPPPL
jgi:transcriptional regulator with PAS, ATPase and Fis domain